MAKLILTPSFVSQELICPVGKVREEFCDLSHPGLYVEVRATSPGKGTYYLRYKDRAGKTCHQKIARTDELSLADARRRAKELKAEIQLGADPRAQAKVQRAVPTFSELFDDHYLPFARQHKRSWLKDESMFNCRIRKRFGDFRINDIRPADITHFQVSMRGEGLLDATADHHIKLIRQMLNRAVEWQLIPITPLPVIKLFNTDNRKENYLEGDDLRALLDVLETDENRGVANLALFLLSTGARVNEALRATWDHIDRTNRVWRIPASNSKSKRVRSVPLNDSALQVLDQLGTEGVYDKLFMSEKTGEPLRYVHKVWERIRNDAGFPHLRLHDLRHQFASFLVNDGRTLYEVQKILGHSSHSVTERYAHLSSKSLMEAANSASVLVRGGVERPA